MPFSVQIILFQLPILKEAGFDKWSKNDLLVYKR